MIDYIKLGVNGISIPELERNPLLCFTTRINPETGEQEGSHSRAYYKNLIFRVYDPTLANPYGRVTLEGSLHVYWNKGTHNYNDFRVEDVRGVIDELSALFNLNPAKCLIRSLEIGVNIQPPEPSKRIIQYSLLHKTKPFKNTYTPKEGSYIQGDYTRHLIKIYDKRKHAEGKGFVLDHEILRIEKKWNCTEDLKKLNVFTLSDLMEFGLHNFESILLQVWDDVLFYCWQTLDGTRYAANYSNPNYWLDLKEDNFKYHRKRLREMLAANPGNIQAQVREAIKGKIEELKTNPTQINPLSIVLNQIGGSRSGTKTVCKVTGLNIEMQKAGSFLLSHSGIRYYLENEPLIFLHLKKEYLTKNWANQDQGVQIRELAHNIRNRWNNSRIRAQRLVDSGQLFLSF